MNFLVNKKPIKRQSKYEYHPKTKYELYNIIVKLLKNGQTDLNCIDVSSITDMRSLFSNVNERIIVKDIDISEWDVSNVEDMSSMFYGCKNFNADLSKWHPKNVKREETFYMFEKCETLEKNNRIPNWYKYT